MKRLLILLTTVAFAFSLPGVALGYWLATDSAGSSRATAAVLPVGRTPIAAVRKGNTVRITVPPAGGPVDDYLIRRYPAGHEQAVNTFRCQGACVETAVADGRWTYTATPELAAWRGGESPASRPVRVDTTAPLLSVTSAGATNDRTPTLTGRAGVVPGDAGVVTVRLLAGSRLLLLRNVAVVGGRWRLTTGSLSPQHTYTVVVRQRDQAGNVGQARSTFVLDTIAPKLTLSAVSWPVLSGTAGSTGARSTSSADSSTVDVQIRSAGRLVETLTASRSGHRWSVTGAGLATGRYTARAVQRDAAGNVGYSVSRTFSVDATPPLVTVQAPLYVNVLNPVISGQAGTAAGDKSAVQLRVLADGIEVQRLATTAHAGVWSARLRPLTGNRQYQVLVSQSDRAGNIGSATASFVVDVVAPVVTAALDGDVLTGTAGTTPAGNTASPDASTVQLLIRSGNRTVCSKELPLTDGQFSTVLPALKPGHYTLVVQQPDGAGNLGQSEPIKLAVPPAS